MQGGAYLSVRKTRGRSTIEYNASGSIRKKRYGIFGYNKFTNNIRINTK